MRYNEFKLTEDELFELKMSPGNLKKMAADTKAVAGMEFEMYVPNAGEGDENDYDSEPDYEMDESFPTGRGWRQEVIDFFRGGDGGSPTSVIQRALDSLDEDYWTWKDEHFEDWYDNNSDIFMNTLRDELPQEDGEDDEEYEERLRTVSAESGGDEYERAMEQTREEYQQEDQFEEFLSDTDINTMLSFADTYSLDWPYYTSSGSSSGGDLSVADVASDFQSAIGRRVTSGGYHSGQRLQTDNYRVEFDSSLSDPIEPEDGGLEFISPPLPLDEMLTDLEKVVKWANRNDCYTNDSCGLHMNISVPDFSKDKLDYVKLAIFLGDEYVLEQFGRQGNTYCASAMKNIKSIAKGQPDKVLTMLNAMQGNLNAMASKIVHTGTTNKYTSINTKDGYIEFRSPGGDWLGEYAADPGRITNTLLRFTVALDIAMKPEAFRQEYMKKLYKVLKPTEWAKSEPGTPDREIERGWENDAIQLFARYSAGMLPQSVLKAFIKDVQKKRSEKKAQPAPPTPSSDQEFSGTWEVVSRPTDEVVYQFGGVGNAIRDAEVYARRWAIETGFDDDYYVRPRMQPRTTGGGFDRAPHTSIYQLVNNRNGQIILGGETRTFAYTVEMANLAIRSYGIAPEDLRIIDMSTNRSYNIDGSPVNRSSTQTLPNWSYSRRDGGEIAGSQEPRRVAEPMTLDNALEFLRRYVSVRPDNIVLTNLNTGETFDGNGNTITAGQRAQQQFTQFTVDYTVRRNGDAMNNRVTVAAANANAAMASVRDELEASGYIIDRIEANPVGEAPARGTESLPPGNMRWLVMDPNDREVYSFVHRRNHDEARQYAVNWLTNQGLPVNGGYRVVPAR